MPEHLRALIVIVGLAAATFALLRSPLCATAMQQGDFLRRRNLWLALTVLAFISGSFWVYAVLSGLTLSLTASKESNGLALFAFLLFIIPPFGAQISGFGLVNFLLELNHIRLLALVILVPALIKILRQPGVIPFCRTWPDLFVLGYVVLQLTLRLPVDTFTNTLREAVYLCIDVLLIYYVASRSVISLTQLRDVLASIIAAAVLLVPMAIFEFVKHWLLYSSLDGAMDIDRWGLGRYLLRNDSLRASVSTGHSLILGTVMVFAFGCYAWVSSNILSRFWRWCGWLMLIAGLVVALGRGPWVGAVMVMIVWLLTGPNRLSRFVQVSAGSIVLMSMLMVTPVGDKVIDFLPFVGTVDEFNVTYRQRLFTVSLNVIALNPWFGSYDFLANPMMEELIQGEGIVDLVNSYIGIALAYGMVGLLLFIGIFASAAWMVLRAVRDSAVKGESNLAGRALLATMSGLLTTIATVSSIGVIPTLYWLLTGLCVAYAGSAATRHVEIAPATGLSKRALSARR